MMFNATFNNISVISWWSVLLVEETRVPVENHQPVASHWHTLSHNVVSSKPWPSGIQTHNVSGDRQIQLPYDHDDPLVHLDKHWSWQFNIQVLHRRCNGSCAHCECGWSLVQAQIGSSKRLKLLFVASALRSKSKDWLALSQDNVSKYSTMSIRGLLFQWTSTIKIQLSVVV